MALKQLLIRTKLDKAKHERGELISGAGAEFEVRKAALVKRENELTAAVEEMSVETSNEDRAEIVAQVEALEKDKAAYETEEKSHTDAVKSLDGQIAGFEDELAELGEKNPPKDTAGVGETRSKKGNYSHDKKEELTNMGTGFFRGILPSQRSGILEHEDTKNFLTQVRSFKGQNRGVGGGDLTIPQVFLGTLRDNMHKYSKLIAHVNLKPVTGTSRINLLGVAPEAVWMEGTGELNELSIKYNQIEFDGFMVGGFISIHDALLEDSDENLASQILESLGQSIGLALDKAILFGTGTKSPMGIFTRLSQTVKPTDWGVNAPEWANLSSSNIIASSANNLEGAKFFKELLTAFSNAKSNYSDGKKFFVMNEKTKNKLLTSSLAFNAAGAIVATQFDTMPILGGANIVLDFMPDDVIIGGYGSLYLLVERSGVSLSSSEHVKFLQNQTLYKAVARYDGKPVKGEAFVAFSLTTTKPAATSIAFTEDTANVTGD